MEPEKSIEPYKSDMREHITVVNKLDQAVVVFMNSGSAPLQINDDHSTTIFASAVKQNINSRDSANFYVEKETAYLHVFVVVNDTDTQYLQVVQKYLRVDTRFNILPKHLTATLATDKRLFNKHFSLVEHKTRTLQPSHPLAASELVVLNEYSVPVADEEIR
ncbi:hypothetical protein DFA_01215 [Cavenderia fasciculata]|uniref:Uncharacterized protein n=1 Tax=Cavenderia fasciculata TaxID=261658 RepID=F4PRJ4_CACFS|nr:uncharacterized protein DFA_01215 [Cavenderia fasciculata]EGG21334.1 hypothetical protein DFA_01215 [Cavenderia fasciculata]|eukprot:XP_004359184.1 hypothetical protein DFA_01215 [Cavenderia fasciculata]